MQYAVSHWLVAGSEWAWPYHSGEPPRTLYPHPVPPAVRQRKRIDQRQQRQLTATLPADGRRQ